MRRAVLAALAVAGLAAGILVALATPHGGHAASPTEWVVQLGVVLAALVLVVTRATGKR
ncbi:MAG TPA: hypothetical protein VNA65_08965 [Candidatus Dormibacteraeota bacterium]|nr:hypothetical protein [Candidatus Dormibacteraeota bacterium]